jgi:NADH:ubiquinone oxidoreductase subunit 5 (subunit L)/multisubunit Na+/H+ antiporter MnhA subunit
VVTRGGSGVIMWIDRNIIDHAVNGAGQVMEWLGKGLRLVQSGKVQWYAVGLFAGVIVLSLFVFNR